MYQIHSAFFDAAGGGWQWDFRNGYIFQDNEENYLTKSDN